MFEQEWRAVEAAKRLVEQRRQELDALPHGIAQFNTPGSEATVVPESPARREARSRLQEAEWAEIEAMKAYLAAGGDPDAPPVG